ncbi:MAG: 16S rRNA (uracil(1498)-N(3))-methyltransferase [Oligoflexia bacterium]|nr:16S rRNA (uracil(1498)-N(3))-methyltransferase [Oligoflexia bacterium]
MEQDRYKTNMRFWIDRACLQGSQFLIKDSLYHHVCHVAKIKKGESFELFCEGLQKYQVVLSFVSSSRAVADIVQTYPVSPLKKPYLHLAFSLPRLSKMENLIEKAVELGVKEIQPFISEFSFFKDSSKLTSSRQKRWNKIRDHSLALSGRTDRLNIQPLIPLFDICVPKEDLALIAYEGNTSSPHLAEILKAHKNPSAIWLFIGSEGGFSLEEIEKFTQSSQAFYFTMGEQILKVETACLFGLSVLKYHYHL